MKRRKLNNTIERNIITGMIVSSDFLESVTEIYKPDYIQATFARTIARWCLDYFDQYNQAPLEEIQEIFEEHERKDLEEEQADLINDFLEDLSDEYERSDKFNSEYYLDQAKEYFTINAIKNTIADIKIHLENNDILEAEKSMVTFQGPRIEQLDHINPYRDEEVLFQSLAQAEKPLFTFPGELGELLNDQLKRECFIGLMGPEKRGKTYWLLEFAEWARKARCNVAMFSAGDMSQKQMVQRMAIKATGRNTEKRYCGKIKIPVLDCLDNQDNECNLKWRTCNVDAEHKDYIPCVECLYEKNKERIFNPTVFYEIRDSVEQLDFVSAWESFLKIQKRMKGKHWNLVTKPTNTINCQMIKNYLDIWERKDRFIPDVIIVDYADIMAPERNIDFRQEQNETWKALRGLSLEYHCLVVVATQTDSDSYTKEFINMKNFTEDKRKYSHVTCMITLNQTAEEKEAGLMRLAKLLVREGESSPRKTVTVLQCLAEGNPFLDSYWT